MKINQTKYLIENKSNIPKYPANFDLFKLHLSKEDKDPLSWICFMGNDIHKILWNMFIETQDSLEISRKDLISIISNSINCSKTYASNRIYPINNKFPIILIEELIMLWGASLNKNRYEIDEKKQEIIANTKYLIQNHPKAKKTLAVKKLTKTLCKIAGAHAADGTLLKRYDSLNILKLAQKDRQYASIYAQWIKGIFGLEPCFNIEKHCYSVRISNKVISRYFNVFLNFPYGNKSKIVDMPRIIKESDIENQKAFACGVMTYEGSIEMSNVVSYGGLSNKLRDELVNIFIKLGLKITKRDYKNKVFLLRTNKLNKYDSEYWLQFFVENTEKWHRLKDIIEDFTYSIGNIETAKDIFDKLYPQRLFNLSEVIELFNKKKKDSITSTQLKKEIKVSNRTLLIMINILKKANILIPRKQGFYIELNTHNLLFNRINLRPIEIAKILKVERRTVQHWKDKDYSIPLNYLEKLVKLADMDLNKIRDSARESFDGRLGYYYNPDIKSWKLPYRPQFDKEINKCQLA